MMSSVIPSEKKSCSGSALRLMKGKNSDRGPLSNRERLRLAVPGCGSRQGIDPDRASNVLDLLFAPVLKRDGQLVPHDFIDTPADADGSWVGDLLQPRRHVHPVAVNVPVRLDDDIAEIDPILICSASGRP